MMEDKQPSFNLWTEPWITLEKTGGGMEYQGIEQTLKNAHKYRTVYESSPLVVVGIQRLLIAIMQFVVDPQENEDLRILWNKEQFSENLINDFAEKYAQRFDLFSPDAPFMQSADLPIQPGKKDKVSSVARLTFDVPSGTYVSHYRHGDEKDVLFCPACVAKHLVTFPAFAISGGQGIKPSINGVPPVYILPGGKNLYQSLVASLVTPFYQPEVRSRTVDFPWWLHGVNIGNSDEIYDIGYCQSLTFPARRIRVYPSSLNTKCTRCGAKTEVAVGTVVYEMGETRPEKAEAWFDPFVAYSEPVGNRTELTPIRPNYRRRGWAIWREFASLFLLDRPSDDQQADNTKRPKVIDQLVELEIPDHHPLSYRCVGLMTDNKAKVFQWMDAGFEIPPEVLKNPEAGFEIRRGVGFATGCNSDAEQIFRNNFRRAKSKRHEVVKRRMEETFWEQLAEPFRQHVLNMRNPGNYEIVNKQWAELVVKRTLTLFNQASRLLGDDAEHLAQQTKAEKELYKKLEFKRKEFLYE
jgi:CRISPR system Cascade subunit CasA